MLLRTVAHILTARHPNKRSRRELFSNTYNTHYMYGNEREREKRKHSGISNSDVGKMKINTCQPTHCIQYTHLQLNFCQFVTFFLLYSLFFLRLLLLLFLLVFFFASFGMCSMFCLSDFILSVIYQFYFHFGRP